MNQEIIPSNNLNTEPEEEGKDADNQDVENRQVGNIEAEDTGKLVAGCSLKQPVEAPPTQEELDKQANELVGNFLLDLYQSFEAEEVVRKQQPDNARDKKTVQDWTVVRHKKKLDKNGNVWYDSESSEDSDDEDVHIDDLPAGSFKRIPVAHKKSAGGGLQKVSDVAAQLPKSAQSPTVDQQKRQYDSGPSIFGFEDFGMFGGGM